MKSIIERSVFMGIPPPPGIDLGALVIEQLPLEYVRTLHSTFVVGKHEHRKSVTEDAALEAGLGRSVRTVLPAEPAKAASPRHELATAAGGPSTNTPNDVGLGNSLPQSSRQAGLLSGARQLWSETAELFSRVSEKSAGVGGWRLRASARVFTLDEHSLLVMQILHWAKHSASAHVYEPREVQMRWRTHHDWKRLLKSVGAVDELREFDKMELDAFRTVAFLFANYSHHAWYWEVVDAMEKLFLTSLIAFVVPRTIVQIVAALLFSFAMLLITMHVRPYKRESVNHLAVLSRVNIVLFLLTGLLLDINPLGFTDNHAATNVIIGGLMTSTVGVSFFLFLTSFLRDWVHKLYTKRADQDDGTADDEDDDDEDSDEDSDGGGDGNNEQAGLLAQEQFSEQEQEQGQEEQEQEHEQEQPVPEGHFMGLRM